MTIHTCRGIAAAAAIGIASAASAQTTRYWDHPSEPALGGSGNWFDADAWRIDFPTGPRTDWNNALGADAFLGGTTGTVTLDANVTAGNLRIQFPGHGPPGYTLLGPGTLTLTGTGTAPAVLNAWHSNHGTATTNIGAAIAGSNGLSKQGAGNVALFSNNPVSGPISFMRGLTHLLDQGRLAGGTSYSIYHGAELRLNNNDVNINDRVNSTAPWTAHGGAIRLIGRQQPAGTHQQMGAFNLPGGQTHFVITPADPELSGPSWLSLAGMSRSSPTAAANFRVQVFPTDPEDTPYFPHQMGLASDSPVRVNIPGLSNDASSGGGIIGAWATVSSAISSANPERTDMITWAKADQFGIRPMIPGGFPGVSSEYDERTSGRTSGTHHGTMPRNGDFGSTNFNIIRDAQGTAFDTWLNGDLTVHSLRFSGPSVGLSGVGDVRTLTINSGGIIADGDTGATAHWFGGNQNLRIRPGADNVFHAHVGHFSILSGDARWEDGSGPTAFVKNGPGTFILTGASATPNTYSGGTFINEGIYRIDHAAAVPVPADPEVSPFIVNGGVLQLNITPLNKRVIANNGAVLSAFHTSASTTTRRWNGGITIGDAPGTVVTFTGPGVSTLFDIGVNMPPGTTNMLSGGGGNATIVVQMGTSGSPVRLATPNDFDGTWFLSIGQVQQHALGALGAPTVRLAGDNPGSILMIHDHDTTVGGLTGSFQLRNQGGAADATLMVNLPASQHDTYSGMTLDGAARKLGLTKSGPGTLTLAGNTTHTGDTTVTAGTLNIHGTYAPAAAASLVSQGGVTNLETNAGTAATSSAAAVTNVAIDATGGQVNFGTSQDLRGVSASTGRVNLDGNHMRLYTADHHATQIALRADLQAGMNTADTGIWDHTAASGEAIGYAVATDPAGNQHVVAHKTFLGDANLDGQVTIADLSLLASNWQRGVSDGLEAFWSHGDFNYDGQVTIADLSLLASNWQAGVPADAPMMSFAEALAMFDVFNGVVIPEPSSLGLLGLAGMLALRRRR